MADYICIDGGTTNTRLRLVHNGQIIDTIRLSIGVASAGTSTEIYKIEIKKAIDTLLTNNVLDEASVTRILASGMITSELGLCTLPHGIVPAGICELHDSMREVLFPEISPIPFVFIRGLKTNGTCAEDTDMMRGEETELMGFLSDDYTDEHTYILPGSHSKVIFTDDKGRITDFFTAMTGEMLSALAGHTILKNAVDLEHAELDETHLLAGYDYCLAEGLNKALFKVRISDTVYQKDKSSVYSFFLGAVLCGEITAILKKASKEIVIGGKSQLKNALYLLLKQKSDRRIVCLSQEEADTCVAKGAIKIYEHKGR